MPWRLLVWKPVLQDFQPGKLQQLASVFKTQMQKLDTLLYEPHHEKTGFLHMRKQRCRSNSEADQHLCFHYTDSTICLLPKSEISSFETSSVAVQIGLCPTWSETPKTGFLTMKLISMQRTTSTLIRLHVICTFVVCIGI